MAASKSAIDLAKLAAEAISNKLGSDILGIDLSEQMVLSEVFLIACGNNERQIEAICDEVKLKLAEIGHRPARIEASASWVLLDYSDLVVHIQSRDLRNYYLLDRLWNDCPIIDLQLAEAKR